MNSKTKTKQVNRYWNLWNDSESNPFPFRVVSMVSTGSLDDGTEVFEATVHHVNNHDDLVELSKKELTPKIVYAALFEMTPIRQGDHGWLIPFKENFFEIYIPFDG